MKTRILALLFLFSPLLFLCFTRVADITYVHLYNCTCFYRHALPSISVDYGENVPASQVSQLECSAGMATLVSLAFR
jgi:hypothetical protein